jgi:hypothetical protein
MSRSTRRPFAAITGTASAKDDKRMAHRGVRRKQNLCPQNLRRLRKICSFLIELECTWNNNWCWDRDGAQCYLRFNAAFAR